MTQHNIITESERLIIRLPQIDDAEASFAIYGDPEVMKFIDDSEPFQTIEQAQKNIERGLAYHEQNSICHWAVIEKESDKLIGHAGFNFFEDTDDLELIIHLNKSYWDKGYATEAGKACVAYAICKLGQNKIVALAETDNIASQKVIQAIGFTFIDERVIEGCLLLYYELKAVGEQS